MNCDEDEFMNDDDEDNKSEDVEPTYESEDKEASEEDEDDGLIVLSLLLDTSRETKKLLETEVKKLLETEGSLILLILILVFKLESKSGPRPHSLIVARLGLNGAPDYASSTV
ncbi:hypothetical protein L6452_22322 [Arctium lappa]|uniref:Uncharacterized protein n=1 Tax=Arctium lappa TaxID=4217 RepID=A0ACB9B087_ARCLA|nr:hypothetical protein L6452_22322 [Arctium lappa]